MLLHGSKSKENISKCLAEIYEIYVKVYLKF